MYGCHRTTSSRPTRRARRIAALALTAAAALLATACQGSTPVASKLNSTAVSSGPASTVAKYLEISPAPGSVLPGSTVTFQWSPNSAVTGYSLSIGTYGLGYYNLYNSPALSASTTSLTVPNIPTNGKPVYVNLSYTINGAVTKTINYTYTAATTP